MRPLLSLLLWACLLQPAWADFQSLGKTTLAASATPEPSTTTVKTPEPAATTPLPPPFTRLTFYDENDLVVGWIDWSSGKLKFRGEFDRSARRFFGKFLKPVIDSYIQAELGRSK